MTQPLKFGTAGLRGPVRDGPDGMNVAVVSRATWAVAQVLTGRGLAGSQVIVGRDARHGSAIFATVTAEVLAAEGFSVLLLPGPVPTPVVAFAVRHTGAAAGIQITASDRVSTRRLLFVSELLTNAKFPSSLHLSTEKPRPASLRS